MIKGKQMLISGPTECIMPCSLQSEKRTQKTLTENCFVDLFGLRRGQVDAVRLFNSISSKKLSCS